MNTVEEILNPDGREQQDAFTDWMRSDDAQFMGAKRLADGSYAGIYPLLFTYALCLGVNELQAYQARFCYDNMAACLHAFENLSSAHDEPEGWIARRPTQPYDTTHRSPVD